MNLALLCANIALILTAVAGFTAIGYWRRLACTASDCVRVLTNDLKEARLTIASHEGAVVNLVQGMSAGKLSGEELRCVREQFPALAPHIERLVNGDAAEKEREQASGQLAGSLVGSGLRGEDLRAAIFAMSPPEDD